MPVPSIQPPPYGTPFSSFITQSDVLKRALSGVSLIEDTQDVEHAQKQLTPGQALVTKNGTLWRWDGLVRKGPASNDAERIRQRQRLNDLEAEAAEIKSLSEQQDQRLTTAQTELVDIQTKVITNKQKLQTAREAREKAKLDSDEKTSPEIRTVRQMMFVKPLN